MDGYILDGPEDKMEGCLIGLSDSNDTEENLKPSANGNHPQSNIENLLTLLKQELVSTCIN